EWCAHILRTPSVQQRWVVQKQLLEHVRLAGEGRHVNWHVSRAILCAVVDSVLEQQVHYSTAFQLTLHLITWRKSGFSSFFCHDLSSTVVCPVIMRVVEKGRFDLPVHVDENAQLNIFAPARLELSQLVPH